jgi:hypothetical protein
MLNRPVIMPAEFWVIEVSSPNGIASNWQRVLFPVPLVRE